MGLAKHILNNIGTAQEATQSLFASGELEGIIFILSDKSVATFEIEGTGTLAKTYSPIDEFYVSRGDSNELLLSEQQES